MTFDLPENFDLDNKEFKYAQQLILYSNKSIYLTGKAGTGKSTFLKYICQNTTKNYIVVAPTGIAAINARGVTINSFFQLPFGPLLPNDRRINLFNYREEKGKLIKNLDLLIIDEISMVRADTIDTIDRALRLYGGNRNKPFGGKQVLFVGDTFQLEPIAKREEWDILSPYYNSPYFFDANVFQQTNLINIELRKVYRQTDAEFINLLDKVRIKEASIADIEALNRNVDESFEPTINDNYITLAARRNVVDSTNEEELNKLEGEEFCFQGIIEGTFGRENNGSNDYLPTDLTLRLKNDAQVIFVKNDQNKRWVNGTIGKVSELLTDSIKVKLDNGQIHKIEKATWENIKYSLEEVIDEKTGKLTKRIVEKVVGTFTQYPIKLAWAITIHKSQGLTFDKVIINLGNGAFAAGQTYVALSRCKSFQGIKLRTAIRPTDIIVREEVKNLARTANNEQTIADELTNGQANTYYQNSLRCLDNLDFSGAFDNFIKAINFRNDLEKPLFRKLLLLKLYRLNYENDSSKSLKETLEKKLIELEKSQNDFSILQQSFHKLDDRYTELNDALTVKNREANTLLRSNETLQQENLRLNGQINGMKDVETLIKSQNSELKADIKNFKRYLMLILAVFFLTLIFMIFRMM